MKRTKKTKLFALLTATTVASSLAIVTPIALTATNPNQTNQSVQLATNKVTTNKDIEVSLRAGTSTSGADATKATPYNIATLTAIIAGSVALILAIISIGVCCYDASNKKKEKAIEKRHKERHNQVLSDNLAAAATQVYKSDANINDLDNAIENAPKDDRIEKYLSSYLTVDYNDPVNPRIYYNSQNPDYSPNIVYLKACPEHGFLYQNKNVLCADKPFDNDVKDILIYDLWSDKITGCSKIAATLVDVDQVNRDVLYDTVKPFATFSRKDLEDASNASRDACLFFCDKTVRFEHPIDPRDLNIPIVGPIPEPEPEYIPFKYIPEPEEETPIAEPSYDNQEAPVYLTDVQEEPTNLPAPVEPEPEEPQLYVNPLAPVIDPNAHKDGHQQLLVLIPKHRGVWFKAQPFVNWPEPEPEEIPMAREVVRMIPEPEPEPIVEDPTPTTYNDQEVPIYLVDVHEEPVVIDEPITPYVNPLAPVIDLSVRKDTRHRLLVLIPKHKGTWFKAGPFVEWPEPEPEAIPMAREMVAPAPIEEAYDNQEVPVFLVDVVEEPVVIKDEPTIYTNPLAPVIDLNQPQPAKPLTLLASKQPGIWFKAGPFIEWPDPEPQPVPMAREVTRMIPEPEPEPVPMAREMVAPAPSPVADEPIYEDQEAPIFLVTVVEEPVEIPDRPEIYVNPLAPVIDFDKIRHTRPRPFYILIKKHPGKWFEATHPFVEWPELEAPISLEPVVEEPVEIAEESNLYVNQFAPVIDYDTLDDLPARNIRVLPSKPLGTWFKAGPFVEWPEPEDELSLEPVVEEPVEIQEPAPEANPLAPVIDLAALDDQPAKDLNVLAPKHPGTWFQARPFFEWPEAEKPITLEPVVEEPVIIEEAPTIYINPLAPVINLDDNQPAKDLNILDAKQPGIWFQAAPYVAWPELEDELSLDEVVEEPVVIEEEPKVYVNPLAPVINLDDNQPAKNLRVLNAKPEGTNFVAGPFIEWPEPAPFVYKDQEVPIFLVEVVEEPVELPDRPEIFTNPLAPVIDLDALNDQPSKDVIFLIAKKPGKCFEANPFIKWPEPEYIPEDPIGIAQVFEDPIVVNNRHEIYTNPLAPVVNLQPNAPAKDIIFLLPKQPGTCFQANPFIVWPAPEAFVNSDPVHAFVSGPVQDIPNVEPEPVEPEPTKEVQVLEPKPEGTNFEAKPFVQWPEPEVEPEHQPEPEPEVEPEHESGLGPQPEPEQEHEPTLAPEPQPEPEHEPELAPVEETPAPQPEVAPKPIIILYKKPEGTNFEAKPFVEWPEPEVAPEPEPTISEQEYNNELAKAAAKVAPVISNDVQIVPPVQKDETKDVIKANQQVYQEPVVEEKPVSEKPNWMNTFKVKTIVDKQTRDNNPITFLVTKQEKNTVSNSYELNNKNIKNKSQKQANPDVDYKRRKISNPEIEMLKKEGKFYKYKLSTHPKVREEQIKKMQEYCDEQNLNNEDETK